MKYTKKLLWFTLWCSIFAIYITLPAWSISFSWFQEANSGIFFGQGGNDFTAFGSNIVNSLNSSFVNNSHYSKCGILSSDYTPLAYDFDDDDLLELVLTKSNSIQLYNMECTKESEISVGTQIRASPVIMNELGDSGLFEIYLITGTHLKGYEYNTTSLEWKEILSILYTAYGNNMNYFTCLDNPIAKNCIGFIGQTTILFNLSEATAQDHALELTNAVSGADINFTGVTNSRTITFSPFNFKVPMCIQVINGLNGVHCDILDEDSLVQNTFYIDGIGSSTANPHMIHSYFAKHEGLLKIFSAIDVTNVVAPFEHTFVLYVSDDTGNKIIDYTFNVSNNITSSVWSIADYDKSGGSEACHIYSNVNENIAKLICYDDTFTAIYNITINDMNVDVHKKGIYLADFIPSNDFLGVATVEGIYIYNSTSGNLSKAINSGYTTGDGMLMGVSNTFATSPSAIYTDNEKGFIIRNTLISAFCGDGICSDFENSFICPLDCTIDIVIGVVLGDIGDPCESNANCSSGLCEYGFCTLKGKSAECIDDSQCLSNECINGKCTKPSYWDSLDASKDQQFGDDSNTNNFIALFFIMGVAGIIIWIGQSIPAGFVALGWFFFSSIFFTLVGWLSPFILLGNILLALMIMVFMFMLKGDSN